MYNIKSILIAGTVAFAFFLPGCGNSSSDDLKNKPLDESGAFASGDDMEGKEASEQDLEGEYKLSVKFTPYIPDYPDLGESGKQLMATRLNAAISKVGYGGDGANPRFILGPSINLLSKNVTGTAPTKYANTYEVTLMTCDVVTETVFESYTVEIKGAGDSPEKAFINGFREFTFVNVAF